MWDTFWHGLWSLILVFAFVAYLIILFNILVDLFWRDHKTSGWVKALWVIFLIVLPYLTALVYLIARGQGMAVRAREAAAAAKKETDEYIRQAAGRSPAQEIADANKLLDTGAISQQEFDARSQSDELSGEPIGGPTRAEVARQPLRLSHKLPRTHRNSTSTKDQRDMKGLRDGASSDWCRR